MSVLNKAVELYREVSKSYSKTSPAYMQIRQYITGHFGHEGTRAMDQVDGEQLPVAAASNQPSKRLRAFQHPNAKTAPKPQSNAKQLPGEVKAPLESQPSEADAVEGNEAPVDGLPTDSANVATGDGNAPVDGLPTDHVNQSQDTQAKTVIDEAEIKNMKAAAVANKYDYESLHAYVSSKPHSLTGAESHKQLASIAIHFAKQAQ